MSGGSGSRKISSSSTNPGHTSSAGRDMDSKTDDLVSYYVDDFMNHFKCDDFLVKLKRKALEGELRSCRFRSIAWKLFLDCLPENPEEWLKASRALREEYKQIINKYDNDPYKENGQHLPGNNPLSQDDDSSWNKYFQDTELKAVINQDVVRTFPEIDFFQDKKMQNMLCTILFHFARENPRISYRQGMHELLAPILFIVHSDQQALLHAKELNLLNSLDENISQEIEEILSPLYLEHDTFFMFRQVMETVEAWYSHETISFKMDSINFEPFSNSLEPSACSVLGIKLRLIYDRILKRFDNELHHHLSEMQIEPQVFGIRWLRLLFGREFSLQDLLVVWDAIFSDGISFSLCDYIFASMLIVIRKLLLNANYSQAMGHLMRYPNVPDTQYIIHLALHLRDPVNFGKPDGYSMNIIPADVAPSPIHLVLPDFERQASINQSNKASHAAQKVSEPPVLRAQEATEIKRANRPKSLPIIQASAPPITTPTPTPTVAAKNGLTTPRSENISSSIASTFSRLTSKKAPQEMQPMPKILSFRSTRRSEWKLFTAKSVSIGFFHGFKDSIFGIFAIRYAIYSNDDQNKSASSSSSSATGSSSTGSSKRTLGSSSRSSKSRKNTMQMIFQCCLLNGCIFWLSLILFDYVMLPLLYSLLRLMFGTQSGLASTVWYWMRPILSHIFDAVWRIPLFLLTRVVNALWFQDIADSTYRGRPSLKSISKLIADTLFSLLIQTLFLIQSLIIAFIPFPLLGRFASLFHLCLLYALYSFEYKWSNMGWELHTRLQVIENNWPYFFGFGAPLAILTSLSDSYFVSGCIFSLLFPLFIISGNEAKPRKVLYDRPLKIFQLVIWLSNKLFQGTIYVTGSNHGKTLINKYKTR